jgi:hypothetical protein
MRERVRITLPLVIASVVGCAFLPLLDCADASLGNSPEAQNTIACSVLEVHTNVDLGVTAVIFHQEEKGEGPRLATLLTQHSGTSIEFQTQDGDWHKAEVARLKSCFGRGLLLFSSSGTRLKEKAIFHLKVPGN